LNALGYELLTENKIEEAITIFQLNVEEYPESWNVYDSLAEAYVESGEKQLAILNYEKSIALNPDNFNGVTSLKKLK
jgi:tetratricopeptide (TPR) repeat protein